MPIVVTCDCGKKLSVKDELAGKRVKCPNCQSPLAIPKPTDDEVSSDDSWDEEDSADDDEDGSARRGKRSAGSRRSAADGNGGRSERGRKGKGRKKQAAGSQNSLLIGLSAGGGLLVVALLVWMFWPGKKAENIAANPGGDAAVTPTTTPTTATPTTTPATTPGTTTAANPSGATLVGQLPRAITQLPDWLNQDTPFDVKQYWITVPPAENAAPLYLDAIAEFSTELQNCFPADPQQTQRFQAVTERMQRYMALQDKPRTAATAAQWDALLRDYDVGFQKLALAQQKPRCVFETELGLEALLPHVHGARHVSRMADQQVRRDLENGNFDRPLQTIEMCLRLSRDLRRRGYLISHLVSFASDSITLDSLVRRVITTPGIKREHCDRLLTLLQEHEQQSQNLHLEAAQGEYIIQRATLRDLLDPQARRALKEKFQLKDDSVGAIWVALFDAGGQDPNAKDVTIQKVNQVAAKLDERQEIAAFDEQYRTIVALGEKPYRERMVGWTQYETTFKETAAKEMKPLVATMMMVSWNAFFEALTRATTKRHGAQALVALRRWQLTHTEPPRDLAQVMSDAGVNAVPRDDFGDAPLKLATVKGVPVVYSIGPDGKDDSGAIEWNPGVPKGPGDFLFQLTPPPN